jgi:hypothetical protein
VEKKKIRNRKAEERISSVMESFVQMAGEYGSGDGL